MIPKNAQLHLFTIHNRHFAFDVGSGSLHALDENAWQVLSLLNEGYSAEQIKELLANRLPAVAQVLAEVKTLQADQQLFVPDRLAETGWHQQATPLKALCLHVAHDCNLRCTYCFAGKGGYGGPRGLMSPEIACRAIDYLIEHSAQRRLLDVDFFGGEPLLNIAAVAAAVRYARRLESQRGKRFHFTLTTNGTLFTDENIAFLQDNDIDLVVSLDGRPQVHDRHRVDKAGRGTHARVVAGLQRLAKRIPPERFIVRGTFTRHNLDFTDDVAYFLAQGWTNLSLEPVVGDPSDCASLTEEHIPDIGAEYERLAEFFVQEHLAGRPFSFFHFRLDLAKGPCLARRLTGCSAGHQYLAVAPDGSLYPCHQFVEQHAYSLGHVERRGADPALGEQFRAAHVYRKQACRTCWARFYCSGGCHANNLRFSGSLLGVHELVCALQKKRLECALWVRANLTENGFDNLASESEREINCQKRNEKHLFAEC
ncbi:MAG TPA: thioether cross-link-forming SCIFF peptide maturase [Firmicutes bacterium]|nr:thioether cross-link-forming SCIFF peptide maturase [Bacillota bacterium]